MLDRKRLSSSGGVCTSTNDANQADENTEVNT